MTTSYPGQSLSLYFSPHLRRLPWHRGGVVFVGVFEAVDARFRMSNTLLFIAISPFRFLDG